MRDEYKLDQFTNDCPAKKCWYQLQDVHMCGSGGGTSLPSLSSDHDLTIGSTTTDLGWAGTWENIRWLKYHHFAIWIFYINLGKRYNLAFFEHVNLPS